MQKQQVNSNPEHRSFTLSFLEENPAIDMSQGWVWEPEKDLDVTSIKTATFSGKNQADDYTNE
ncbi:MULTISPECIES: hypothetical protein [unclassified Halorhodospira]|uniref:hypothetical protein n=1 Tax=unclassified Halorhodospira TaxID=2626748 RepID=UPI001EE98E0A|nr:MULTISPECIES: hypothetical protein [unclassified Halorhodospira]MCG5541898.1 hypothetical protein [Halorhodospira sp. M39old]MCG5546964.1 hypothetical protein [Halorhodospira sp. M38]